MKNEILTEKNIVLKVPSETKMKAIERVGGLLVRNGYVNGNYIEGMKVRENDISTYIGNGIAIPHAVSE